MLSTIGHIHSYETFGTVDGPGIRFVAFLQGCFMRCKYCHNRDTWDLQGGKDVTVGELINEIKTYKQFYTSGGVTASGGEAIIQPYFVRDFFTAAHEMNLHTCLDTNGYVRKYEPVIDELLDVTDLVMLDLKQMNDVVHQDLIGVSNKRTLEFAQYLQKRQQKTWIRYVIVPGYTDDEESAHLLGQFIENMDNVEKVELLPYHKLGKNKWETLGYKYELEDVESPSAEVMKTIKDILNSYGKKVIY